MKIIAAFIFLLTGFLHAQTEVNFDRTVNTIGTMYKIEAPTGFCVDNLYNYFILDDNKDKIWILNSTGELINQIPEFSNIELFGEPIAIEIMSDGNIAVLDKGSHKVVIVNREGEKISEFGSESGTAGSLDTPLDLAVDAHDNIYVIEESNQQIIRFTQQGLFRGAVKVASPKAITVDLAQNIYVLCSDGENSVIRCYTPELIEKRNIALKGFQNPSDITVNLFNEFYLVDSELGSVFHLDSAGTVIGTKFGVKSSSAGRAQFGTPTRVFYSYIDNNKDRVYIFDREFEQIQSFNITVETNRKRVKTMPQSFNVQFMDKGTKNYKVNLLFKGKSFLINEENTLIALKDSSEIFRINESIAEFNKFDFSEPVALAADDKNLYILDEDNSKIIVVDNDKGEFQYSIGSGGSDNGNLDEPKDLVLDHKGKLYVADFGNGRINIYNNQGIYIDKINIVDDQPVKLGVDKENRLYVLTAKQNTIYRLNPQSPQLEAVDLFLDPAASKISSFDIVDEGILIFYDDNTGSVYMLKDDKRFAQFLSKGEGKFQMNTVTSFTYDAVSKSILLNDDEDKIYKRFKILLSPLTPADVKITVNDFGYTEISWTGDQNRAALYKIYRSSKGKGNFQLFDNEVKTEYIVEEPQPDIFEYAVQAVSDDNLVSNLSEPVTDQFSYYVYLKNSNPRDAINKLKEIQSINKTAVENRILTIYREMIANYRNELNYEMVLTCYTEMQGIRPDDIDLYIEKSNIYKQLLRYQDAINELNKGKLISPENLNIYTQLARLSFLNKDYHGVISICNEGLGMFPSNEKLMESKAEAYEELNEIETAIEQYKKLALQTGSEQYYISAGRLLSGTGKFTEAQDLYTQAQNTGAAGPSLYAAMGEAYMEEGKFADAIFQLEKSVSMDSLNSENIYLLGLANSKKRNKKEAVRLFERAIELDNTAAKYYIALGDDLELTNENENATKAFERAVELSPENSEAQFKLGLGYLKQKRYDYACKHLATANKLLPESAEIKSYLDKALTARDKFNASREPVEFDRILIDDIFPSLYYYYNKNSIGIVSIFNTKNEAFEDLSIEISSPQLLAEPTVIKVPVLLPNDFSENLITVNLNRNIITNSNDGTKDLNVDVKINYNKDGKPKTAREVKTVKLHSLNSISWDDKKHLASFIDPENQNIRNFVTTDMIGDMPGLELEFPYIPKPILQSAIIWEYLRKLNITYVQDPNLSYAAVSETGTIDYIQFASQTLSRKTGDCDDLVTLIANCLESVGIETAYIDVPGHVFLAFNTGIAPEDVENSGLTRDKIIINSNKVWIPLESTVISKSSFIDSWDIAITRYKTTLKDSKRLEVVEIGRAAETFPPIKYPFDQINLSIKPAIEDVRKDVNKSLSQYMNLTKEALESELLATIKLYPKNSFAMNKLALYYAQNGKYDKAKEYLVRILTDDTKNIDALINLGNIYLIEKDLSNAESRYYQALLINDANPGLLVNMTRMHISKGEMAKAKSFFDKAIQIDQGVKIRYNDLYNQFYN